MRVLLFTIVHPVYTVQSSVYKYTSLILTITESMNSELLIHEIAKGYLLLSTYLITIN